jgi:methyl-accepting chemotaxis protein
MNGGRSGRNAGSVRRRIGAIHPAVKVAVAVADVVLMVVTLSLFVFYSSRQYDADRRLAARSLAVRTAIREMLVALLDTESMQRAYLLTGEATYDTSYRMARATLLDRMTRLQSLAADDPRQRSRIPTLESLIRRKLDFLDELTARRQSGLQSLRGVDLTRGHHLIIAIRNILSIMDADEAQDQKRREAQAERTLSGIRIGLFASTGLNVAILLAVLGAVARGWAISRRLERTIGLPLPGETETTP